MRASRVVELAHPFVGEIVGRYAAALRIVPLFVALLLARVAGVGAQEVRGTLVDEADGAPIAGATVTLIDDRGEVAGETATDAAGAWSLRAPGTGREFRVRVEADGFARVETEPFRVGGRGVVMALETRREVLLLGGISAEANHAGLLARSRTHLSARTLLPDDLAARIARVRARDVGDVLQSLIAGLRLSWDRWPTLDNTPLMSWQSTSRGRSFGAADFRSPWEVSNPLRAGTCAAIVALDGEPRYYGRPETILNRLVPLSRVRAVEVYTDPNFLPRELDFESRRSRLDPPIRCGVVVIWTAEGLGVP